MKTKFVSWKFLNFCGYSVDENGNLKYIKVGNKPKTIMEEKELEDEELDEPAEDLPDDEEDLDEEEENISNE